MIKRRESKTTYPRRPREDRAKKKRRLMMEGLEKRELLAVDVLIPTVPNIPQFTGPRNLGTVQAFQFLESENISESGLNDANFNADLVPLGNGPGQQNTVDINGTMSFTAFPNDPLSFATDVDTFAFDLKAGDILDISMIGTAGSLDLFYENGGRWFATDTPQAAFYPADSPLQTLGNITAAQVVPEDGRYFLTVSPIDTTVTYTIGLRTYRPIVEQFPVGTQQFIFLDFDGAVYPASIFTDGTGVPQPGIVRIPTLQESLPILGIEELDDAGLARLIDLTVAEVERQFDYLGDNGNAGDFDTTGRPGDYGVTILNSRDHADPGSNPLVTRVLVGGTAADAFQPGGLYGISSTIDIGNFSMDDIVIAVLDQLAADSNAATVSPTASVLDAAADLLALTISHEAGHSFGLRHTERANTTVSIIDGGVDVDQDLGVGPDGIYGTLDDENVDFIDDRYDMAEGFIGINRVLDGLANTLVTGTTSSALTGRVFVDANRDGSGAGDSGLANVMVFADVNGNGVFDGNEPRATTDASGNFTLAIAPGTVNVVAMTPDEFTPTTPTTVSSSGGAIAFGFNQVVSNITGSVFVDNNGNGFRDIGDAGRAGVYVFVDLDGDDRPDLGEPGTNTSASGTYSLNFPGPGTYTIRDVIPAGFEQTFPSGDEHTVFFDGVSVGGNFDFGLLPSQDFGDAPDSYGTLLSSNGARHGITSGLRIGATVDRDNDGQPTVTALGDDLAGIDDEDGVRISPLTPPGPGAPATFLVTVVNTTGAPAFLQGFMNFNPLFDGDFDDVGEHFAVDVPVPQTGPFGIELPVVANIPVTATPGGSYARFRLSGSSGIGPRGFADTGEVEDITVRILGAAQVANPDSFVVPRNSDSNVLRVIDCVGAGAGCGVDFETADNLLTIDSLNTVGTQGTVRASADGRAALYTPRNGFIGRDVFSYRVIDQFGNRSGFTTVEVNVSFQSSVPIALDDAFEVAEGSVNRALNVLDNDIASLAGGITITSATGGNRGGTVTIVGGGQSLRYTPLPGFAGTEQFIYSIQDSAGTNSSATVTVDLLPGSRDPFAPFEERDQVAFTIDIFDPTNTNTPVTNVQVGKEFLVRVSVNDIRNFANPEGVASAFLDLLYTDELVSTVADTDPSSLFDFEIEFGSMFPVFQRGDADIPGLINEVGGVQNVSPGFANNIHAGPVTLFTLTMKADAPGVALFVGDPANDSVSETTVLASDTALLPGQLNLGRTELLIFPASDDFASAVDDSFPEGLDSNGNPINNASPTRNRLDVLANDNFGGPGASLLQFDVVRGPTRGNIIFETNGTPSLDDDFISYRANAGENGLDRFTYSIVTSDNVRSTAEVTIALGTQNATADVSFDFELVKVVGVDGSGRPIVAPVTDLINEVTTDDTVGIQIFATDERPFSPTFVFAGFMDLLYNNGIIQPSDTFLPSDDFDFDVVFGPNYLTDGAVGTAIRPGIIDEFGSLFGSVPSNTIGLNGGLLATVFFDAVNVGQARVVGSPADASPFQDTLLFRKDEPVPVENIRFESLQFNVNLGTAPLQNGNLRQDVNDDGAVSAIDALLVINEVSRGSAAGEIGGITASHFYTDVNGDDETTVLDALQVINYLANRNSQPLAGEAVVASPTQTSTGDSSSEGADEVFAAIDQDPVAKVTSSDAPANSSGPDALSSENSSTSENDSDDVLDLLADDVSSQWG